MRICAKRWEATISPGFGGMGPLVSTQSLETASVAATQAAKSAWVRSPFCGDHVDRLQRGLEARAPGRHRAAAGLVAQAEQAVLARPPQVGVDHDHLLAGERQRDGEVGHQHALALALQAARDHQGLDLCRPRP